MDTTKIFILVFGMAVVTYIPRALPVLFAGKIKFGEKTEKFLKLIPYTAMTSLVFPGIFTIDAEKPYIGIIGGAVAGLLAWKKCPVMVCVLSAIAVDFILYLFL